MFYILFFLNADDLVEMIIHSNMCKSTFKYEYEILKISYCVNSIKCNHDVRKIDRPNAEFTWCDRSIHEPCGIDARPWSWRPCRGNNSVSTKVQDHWTIATNVLLQLLSWLLVVCYSFVVPPYLFLLIFLNNTSLNSGVFRGLGGGNSSGQHVFGGRKISFMSKKKEIFYKKNGRN